MAGNSCPLALTQIDQQGSEDYYFQWELFDFGDLSETYLVVINLWGLKITDRL